MNPASPVKIVPYDPRWPALYESARSEILAVLQPFIARIEHVGSTSVPRLAAKPVIDILIGVHRLVDAPAFLPPLAALGYQYVPMYEITFPQRRYLHRIIAGEHTHHLHIVEPHSEFFQEHLLFRDYLRTHPEAVVQYARLKYELAEKFRYEREAYTEAKSGFIQQLLQRARLIE